MAAVLMFVGAGVIGGMAVALCVFIAGVCALLKEVKINE